MHVQSLKEERLHVTHTNFCGVHSTHDVCARFLWVSIGSILFPQISAGVRHCLALDTPPPARGDVMFAIPLSIPARYPALRHMSCKSIHARLMLLNHFAKLMVASWKLFSIQNIRVGGVQNIRVGIYQENPV